MHETPDFSEECRRIRHMKRKSTAASASQKEPAVSARSPGLDADHAEFLRLQCRLAQIAEDEPLRADYQSRADKLLNAHREEWMSML